MAVPTTPHLAWGGTTCPGARWREWVPQLRAQALAIQEDDMTQAEFNEMFLEAVKTVGIPRDSRETGGQVFHNWATLARIAETLWGHVHDDAKHGAGTGPHEHDAIVTIKLTD